MKDTKERNSEEDMRKKGRHKRERKGREQGEEECTR